ncbi:RING finger protein 32-like [Ciona intestinalis]
MMNKKQLQASEKVPSTALVAVAYQDHLLKDLAINNLSLVDPFKANRPSLNQRLKEQEHRRKVAIKNAKSTIDTGIKRKKASPQKTVNKQSEYVLDPKPRPLTLAQKFGLIPHNKDQEKLLTESEWGEVKKTSMLREDFKSPCVICKDDFRVEDQVLLSCSHVFHRACLKAFERFSGQKTCPMCRRQQYQTRVVHEGTKHFKHKSATKIQSTWRGYVVRKWYKELRRSHPPKNPILRKKFFEDKLAEITDRFVAETMGDTVDRFLQDIDQSVQSSRNIFRHFENTQLNTLTREQWSDIELRATERGATECPICLRGLADCRHSNETTANVKNEPIALLSCSHVFHATCLNALESFSLDNDVISSHSHDVVTSTPNVTGPSSNLTPSYLMTQSNPDQPPDTPLSFKCPVCRSLYRKRIVEF